MRLGQRALVAAAGAALAWPAAAAGHDGHVATKAWPGGATITRAAPVLVVHGYSSGNAKNCDDFNPMTSKLQSMGGPAPIRLRYYDGDTNCDHNISHHGTHTVGDGHQNGSHTVDTPIQHLAYHLAWYINDHFGTVSNVDVIAHSMGGLVTRYMLYAWSRGTSGYPAVLMVQDAVTMGSPHLGTYSASACSAFLRDVQCQQMDPNSSFMTELNNYGQNPQGYNGTDWTLIGSENDNIVSQGSATGMDSAHKVLYGGGRNHDDYYKDTSDLFDASVKWDEGWDGHAYYHWDTAPHVVRWIDRSRATYTW